MVLQTNKFYLAQHFQYPVDYKRSKAEYVSDKSMLKLILPVIRSDDFWITKLWIKINLFQYILIMLNNIFINDWSSIDKKDESLILCFEWEELVKKGGYQCKYDEKQGWVTQTTASEIKRLN